MPTPVAHTLSGCCIAALTVRRFPEARAPVFVAATLLAANLPDLDLAAAALGATHQGLSHSLGFAVVAALPL
jgi:hypothetical protein